MKGRVTIFSITGCPFCVRAKTKLRDELNLEFVDINLDRHPERRQEAMERSGKRTVPQIFFNNIHVGGFDDLDKLSADKMEELIKEIKEHSPPPEAPQPPPPEPSEDTGSPNADDDVSFTCEMDEYAELVKAIRESGLVKDHKAGFLKTYRNSFIGREVVDWLVSTRQIEREKAIQMCKQIVERRFGHSVEGEEVEFKDDASVYRFLEDDESNALNAGLGSLCEPRPAPEVGEELRHLILQLYNKHLSPDGKGVDYTAMGQSTQFQDYVKHTAELQRVNLETASREGKLAFFINIYNALVIHATVTKGPPVNLWQRYKFFNTVSYIIGGHVYCLNDIENGVLRSNRRAIGAIRRPFSKKDPRLKIALDQPEPKVHFALVCGAKSCPPIKTYSAKGVDEELNVAAEAFLEGEDGCRINMIKREIRLSKIFQWYKEDFGSSNAEVARFVSRHMAEGEKKSQLDELLHRKDFKEANPAMCGLRHGTTRTKTLINK
ncbi:uncharacterized protein LOC5505107 [Nematostella vectensis]|uniref:uncharacterized protein LOC5505107 n=1 Tax=Nematostella vectensis TaxID=45351 RepID=UPI0020778B83|nr:uncharacterized protein LOC5505107 [Nematostella vectensis]